MSQNRIVFSGVAEQLAELAAFVPTLVAEATPIIYGEADAAAAEIVSAYPNVSGNLRAGVKVKKTVTPTSVKAVVENRAHLAYIYEYGTVARHYFTDSGVEHKTGKMPVGPNGMPPGNVLVPRVMRHRRVADEQINALLLTHGVTVTGE